MLAANVGNGGEEQIINRLKRIYIFTTIVLVIVFTVLFMPLYRAYETKVDAMHKEVVDRLESFLGFRVEYGSISPSLLRYIEVRDLRVLSSQGGSHELLYLKRIRVHYRLWAIIKGEPSRAFYKISLDNSRLEFDPRRDTEVFALFDRLLDRGQGDAAPIEKFGKEKQDFYPILGMTISGRNLTLVYHDAWGHTEISRLFFSFQPEGDNYKINLRGRGRFTLSESSLLHWGGGDIRINGSIGAALDWGETLLTLGDWKTSAADFSKLSLQVQFEEQKITLRKIQDRVPFDLAVKWDTPTGRADFSFSAENFIPDDHMSLRHPPEKLGFLSSIGLTGTADASMAFPSRKITYTADMKLSVPINPWISTPMTMEVELEGEGPRLSVESLDLTSPRGLLFFSGRADFSKKFPFPDGTLKLSKIDLPRGKLSAMVYLRSRDGENLAFAPWARYGNLPLKDWELRFTGDFGGFDFVTALSYDGVDWENRFETRGSLALGEAPFFQGEIVTRQFPLGLLGAAMAGREGEEGLMREVTKTVLSSRSFFSSNLKQFSFSSVDFLLSQRGRRDNHLKISFFGNNTSLTIRDLLGRYGKFDFSLTGTALFEPKGLVEWKTSLEVEELNYELTGNMKLRRYLQIYGNYGLNSLITFDSRGIAFNALIDRLPLPLEEGLTLSLNTRGRYKNRKEWILLFREAALEGLPAVVGDFRENRLSLGGQATPRGIFLSRINYTDALSSLGGNGEILLFPGENAGSGWFQFTEDLGDENHLITFDYDGETVLGSFKAQNFPLGRLGALPIKGRLDGEAAFAGPWNLPDLTIALSLKEGSYNGTPVAFSSKMAFQGMTISLEDLSASYLSQELTLESGYLNLADGTAGAGGDFRGIIQDNPLVGNFSLSLSTIPMKSRRDLLKVVGQDFQGTLEVAGLRVFNEEKDPWVLAMNQTSGKLNLQGGPKDSLALDLYRNGSFNLSLSRDLPLSLTAEGTLSSGNIKAECQNIFMNFEAINKFFTIPNFTIIEGQAEGDFLVSGSINDPDIYGQLRLTGAKAKVRSIQETLSLDPTLVLAKQKTLTAKDVILKSAGGSAIMNCEFTLDHLLPYDFTIDIETLYNRDPYLTMEFPRISVDGYLQGAIRLTGSSETLKITGVLNVYSGTLTLNTDVENQEDRGGSIIADLTIRLRQNNQFYWPSKSFPILKAYAEGGEELLLKVNTLENTLSLLGKVDIKGGEIFYFRRNFYLENGEINFNETKERFDPIVNARAVLREIDSQGELLKIYLIAENMTLSNFNPRFESEPYRQNSEVLAILGQSLVDTTEGSKLLGDALLITSDVIGQFSFLQQIQNTLRDLLRLDMLSFRTHIFSNLLLNRFITDEGNSPITVVSPESYLDNTTLILGKYFGQDFFLQAMLQMDYNGNQTGQVYPQPVFKIDAEVSLEWKSPLALIQFNLYPNFYDKNKEFLTTSLGLFWSFTY